MNKIGCVLLAFLLWFWLQIETGKGNPCSAFSDHPGACNSDLYEERTQDDQGSDKKTVK
jgi:hypothetical protein